MKTSARSGLAISNRFECGRRFSNTFPLRACSRSFASVNPVISIEWRQASDSKYVTSRNLLSCLFSVCNRHGQTCRKVCQSCSFSILHSRLFELASPCELWLFRCRACRRSRRFRQGISRCLDSCTNAFRVVGRQLFNESSGGASEQPSVNLRVDDTKVPSYTRRDRTSKRREINSKQVRADFEYFNSAGIPARIPERLVGNCHARVTAFGKLFHICTAIVLLHGRILPCASGLCNNYFSDEMLAVA